MEALIRSRKGGKGYRDSRVAGLALNGEEQAYYVCMTVKRGHGSKQRLAAGVMWQHNKRSEAASR